MKFKSLTDKKEVNVIQHIKEYIEKNPDTEIYVGCDSQNVRRQTQYAVVIVLHKGKNGGHVLYSKDILPIIRDKFTRLWKEVEYSIEVANYLVEKGIQKPKFIDLDFNPDPRYQSNSLLRAALGYVESLGYTPRCKPEAASATYVADVLCK